MSASRVVLVVGVVVLCFALYSNTQQIPMAPLGVFQLVPAQYSVPSPGGLYEQHTVFLVDSKNGQVWEYLPPGKTDDGKLRDAKLVQVERVR
jgi:hypothetical protein